MATPGTPPAPGRPEGRAAFAISQVYYYAAAVVGVGFVLGGGIAALTGVRDWITPAQGEPARNGAHGALIGLSFLLPGLLTVLWHLRESRRREGLDLRGVFWGGSLYYHLVSFVSLCVLLGGAAATLGAIADTVLPQCWPTYPSSSTFGTGNPPVTELSCDQMPFPGGGARQIVSALIVVVVAGAVFAWHLRQGRTLTSAAVTEQPPTSGAAAGA